MRSFGRPLLAALGLGALGCQALLGDFEIEEPPPSTVTTLGSDCAPSAFRCRGAELEMCGADRRSWEHVATCASAGECDASAATCHLCHPGDYGCDGLGNLQICDNTAKLKVTQQCATPISCAVKDNRATGLCVDPLCAPGTFQCTDNELRACAPERDHFELVAVCASAPLCDADAAAAQFASHRPPTCLTPTCLPGTFACEGSTLERCNGDQNGWEVVTDCGDPTACNPLDGTCTAAGDGVRTCSGASVVKNGPAGFVNVATCDSPALCDPATGSCRKRTCGTLGARRCRTDEKDLAVVEECTDDGSWLVREVCATLALCSQEQGRCLERACELGTEERCAGPLHQRCSGDLTHWDTIATCEAGEVCGPSGCEQNACTLGRVRCVDALLESCGDDKKWDPRLVCLTKGLCKNTENTGTGFCAEPECGGAKGEYRCSGSQTIQFCPFGRDAWHDLLTCITPPAIVCNADPLLGKGRPDCAICTPLAYSCDDTTLKRCAADGQSNPAIASCPGGCSVTSGEPSCLTDSAQMP